MEYFSVSLVFHVKYLVMKQKEFIPVSERLPEKEGYYAVRYADGTEDQKPYRIRGKLQGWLSEKVVTHWR